LFLLFIFLFSIFFLFLAGRLDEQHGGAGWALGTVQEDAAAACGGDCTGLTA
jgi:hypothetical protein